MAAKTPWSPALWHDSDTSDDEVSPGPAQTPQVLASASGAQAAGTATWSRLAGAGWTPPPLSFHTQPPCITEQGPYTAHTPYTVPAPQASPELSSPRRLLTYSSTGQLTTPYTAQTQAAQQDEPAEHATPLLMRLLQSVGGSSGARRARPTALLQASPLLVLADVQPQPHIPSLPSTTSHQKLATTEHAETTEAATPHTAAAEKVAVAAAPGVAGGLSPAAAAQPSNAAAAPAPAHSVDTLSVELTLRVGAGSGLASSSDGDSVETPETPTSRYYPESYPALATTNATTSSTAADPTPARDAASPGGDGTAGRGKQVGRDSGAAGADTQATPAPVPANTHTAGCAGKGSDSAHAPGTRGVTHGADASKVPANKGAGPEMPDAHKTKGDAWAAVRLVSSSGSSTGSQPESQSGGHSVGSVSVDGVRVGKASVQGGARPRVSVGRGVLALVSAVLLVLAPLVYVTDRPTHTCPASQPLQGPFTCPPQTGSGKQAWETLCPTRSAASPHTCCAPPPSAVAQRLLGVSLSVDQHLPATHAKDLHTDVAHTGVTGAARVAVGVAAAAAADSTAAADPTAAATAVQAEASSAAGQTGDAVWGEPSTPSLPVPVPQLTGCAQPTHAVITAGTVSDSAAHDTGHVTEHEAHSRGAGDTTEKVADFDVIEQSHVAAADAVAWQGRADPVAAGQLGAGDSAGLGEGTGCDDQVSPSVDSTVGLHSTVDSSSMPSDTAAMDQDSARSAVVASTKPTGPGTVAEHAEHAADIMAVHMGQPAVLAVRSLTQVAAATAAWVSSQPLWAVAACAVACLAVVCVLITAPVRGRRVVAPAADAEPQAGAQPFVHGVGADVNAENIIGPMNVRVLRFKSWQPEPQQ